MAEAPAAPLPFRGRLVEGDPGELPPSVAMSLTTDNSPVEFSYREELTHESYRVSPFLSALDPATYLGASLGDYGASAFATLTITRGNQVIGDYTARAHVAASYSMYKEHTHSEIEHAARAAVRRKIDEKLAEDATRLARAASESGAALGAAAGQ